MPFNINSFSFVTYTSHSIFAGNISYINKLISGGVENIILYPNSSFLVSRIEPTRRGELKIEIGPGLGIINPHLGSYSDSVMIHVYDKYVLDLNESSNYFNPDNLAASCGVNKYIHLFVLFNSAYNTIHYALVNTITEQFLRFYEYNCLLWLATILVSNDCEHGDFIPTDGINMKYSTIPLVYTYNNFLRKFVFKRTPGTTISYPVLYDVNGGIVYRDSEGRIVWGDYVT